jgi:phosphoglycerate dehydrogenase-like enzyme
MARQVQLTNGKVDCPKLGRTLDLAAARIRAHRPRGNQARTGIRHAVNSFDPYVSTEVARRAGVEMAENWRNILGDVDVLSLHLPLTPQTRDIVDADVLAARKPTAILVNAARGGLVDDAALYTALTTRMVDGAAALNTFAVEPFGRRKFATWAAECNPQST